ncbi:rRNA-processing protein FYV7 [Iris pallida]|uniref:rRNA-processing protein FYV7 n=1 Tax=Iris pallida TaxID=29817 RepID=A0AAX6FM22_IRIPA|nr:rRNA-processing protein FYV7 [Iris pallida]
MKEKRDERGGGHSSRNHKNKKSKNERRLGGRALSLHAFANAKSAPSSSAYNPSIIKKQREFYKNAKFVSKFKKSIKREGQSAVNISPERRLESVHENNNENKKRAFVNKKKKKGSLQDLRKEFEKKQAEAEKEKMEREAIIQAKTQERARAEARRKAQRENMFKKTRSGQPVMKYRIEHLLQGILDSSN